MPESKIDLVGTVTFVTEAGEFRLDVVEAARELRRIGDDCNARNLSNWEHLDALAGWVKEKSGVRLTPGQALALWHEIPAAYEVFTTRHAASGRGVPTSASSTASTPPA